MEQKKAKLLRIFINETDQHDGEALYKWITRKARETGMRGATVLRGMEGFGAHSRMHTSNILRLSQDLPIIIEIIDLDDKVDAFLNVLDPTIKEGLITIENIFVHFYRSDRC